MRIGFDVGSVPAGRCSGRCVTSGRADEPSAQSVIEEEVVDDAGKHRQKRQDENGHQSNHPWIHEEVNKVDLTLIRVSIHSIAEHHKRSNTFR